MKRPNIRMVTGTRQYYFDQRYVRIQNRAAAVLDACDDLGMSHSIELVAHLHHLQISQIEKDLHGEPADVKRRFGFRSTVKLEQALKRCRKELKNGENQALVAVANHIPFNLLRSLEDNGDIKKIASTFLKDMREKLLISEKENSERRQDKSNKVIGVFHMTDL